MKQIEELKMKVCPKCKLEYRKGFEYCSDCNVKLEGKENIDVIDKSNEIEIEYLMSVSNEIEAKHIEDILKHNNIPVLKKHRGAGEYIQLYLGASNLGINIYVPSNLKEMAKYILRKNSDMQQYYEENIDQKSEESLDEVEDMYNRKRRRKIWILVIALSIPAILALLVILMSIFTIITN